MDGSENGDECCWLKACWVGKKVGGECCGGDGNAVDDGGEGRLMRKRKLRWMLVMDVGLGCLWTDWEVGIEPWLPFFFFCWFPKGHDGIVGIGGSLKKASFFFLSFFPVLSGDCYIWSHCCAEILAREVKQESDRDYVCFGKVCLVFLIPVRTSCALFTKVGKSMSFFFAMCVQSPFTEVMYGILQRVIYEESREIQGIC